ncbi:DNA polymerase III, subunits gamma and tau [Leptothrix cholodnii SP-6]|uniref:DNA polymerase III subunit gamma/tau n=1 Tax=Leptothrix cholodnii (strain ATCC 51168 / LMG 8142 / SP-6) TaxID=395495 RepID=B1Y1E4_LEPCP|nr:DNA polymerase III subunit gamma/tau [Leptothrix cholodnii]ACB34243.1 DNA polymerase III, subunits gamma and tau [Leptothrix cholodnii SP-6]
MSYIVLARKYRPRSFAELVGQAHVVQALSNALTQQRLHHAYLFTGTRGVGKTTVSRILAKSLNCVGADGLGGITATPCGVCSACRDIDAGRHVDYVELDAASNRGVDEISQLLDQAVYKPVVGRFKVYMIDEVHMLSTTAFNAMLKTLEEPPEYLKFVLATTDPQKVPVTVLSRCLQFNLRPMATETVFEHLQTVLNAESVPFEDPALRLLARGARGSMRDALSLTDQAIAYAGGHLGEAAVRQMLGAVDRGHGVRIVEALAASDGVALVRTVDELRAQGLSAAGTLEELADLAQQMAVLQAVPQAIDPTHPDAAVLQGLAPLLPADETQLLYSIALHGRAELALAPDEYSGLVMVLLRMLAFRPAGGAAASAVRPAAAAPIVAAAPVPAPAVAASRELLRTSGAVSKTTVPSVAQAPSAPPVRPEPPRASPTPMAAPVAAPMAAPTAISVSEPAPPLRPAAAPAAAAETPPWDDEPPWVREESESSDGARPTARNESQPPSPEVVDAPQAADIPAPHPAQARWLATVQQLLAQTKVTGLVRELAWQAECTGIDDAADPVCWQLRVERESLRQASHRERLQAAMSELLGQPQRLEIDVGAVTDSAARRDVAARSQAQAQAERVIRNDPVVQQLLARYPSARIVPGSVRPR